MKHDQDIHAALPHTYAEGSRNDVLKTHHRELLALKELFSQVDAQTWHVHEHLRLLLDSLPKNEMVMLLHELELSDKNIKFAEIMALEKQDHDIHAAIREVKKERKISSADDPIDHMNYTAL